MSALAQDSYEFQNLFASNEFLKRILENNFVSAITFTLLLPQKHK